MRNSRRILTVLASTHEFLAFNALYYKRIKRMLLLLVSYAGAAMFLAKVACTLPGYGYKKPLLFHMVHFLTNNLVYKSFKTIRIYSSNDSIFI